MMGKQVYQPAFLRDDVPDRHFPPPLRGIAI
jgi:hypothetical protein